MEKKYTLGHFRGEAGRKLLKKFDRHRKRFGLTRISLIKILIGDWVNEQDELLTNKKV